MTAHPFSAWAATRMIAFDDFKAPLTGADLDRFQTAIGSSRLVGLGESRHDTREQLMVKGMLIRHLVEDFGFRTLILEESVPHAEILDRYITSGDGDLRQVMGRLAGWYLLETDEMIEFVEWIRRFNRNRASEDQIRIFGVDITAPAMGIRLVLDGLAATESGTQLDDRALGLDLHEGDFWPATWQRYRDLSDNRRRELRDNYDRLLEELQAAKPEIVASSSEQAYERLAAFAEIGRDGNSLFLSVNREQGGAIRERGMARETLRVLDRLVPGKRAILWAHNLHVAKSSFRMPGLAEGELEPMGMILDSVLGEDYLAVGAAFGSGAYPRDLPPGERIFETPNGDVVDGALARVGSPLFILDLREVDRDSAAGLWLREEREWIAQDASAFTVPARAFDLVYFVDSISRSQPTSGALDRL